MKLFSAILTCLAALSITSAFAADREKPGRRPGPDGASPPDRPSRAEMLKKFDKDGDGKLSKDEQAALREEFTKRRGAGGRPGGPDDGNRPGGPGGPRKLPPQILEKFDKDGDGEINEKERAAMREEFAQRRAEFMKKFDKDGDGKLNEKERAAARKGQGQGDRPGGKPGARPPRDGDRPGGKPGARPPRDGDRPGGKPGARPPRDGDRPGGKPGGRPPRDG